MSEDLQPSRFKKVSPAATRILAVGESDRYEFKRDIDAVTPKLLAALANWVSLEPTRDAAHLLVGVDEVEDKSTGLVYGAPFGLPKGLDRAVARIQDMASKTRPIPIDARIVEEGVEEPRPFLRIEIRPTMAPHFDDEGRRQPGKVGPRARLPTTNYSASTLIGRQEVSRRVSDKPRRSCSRRSARSVVRSIRSPMPSRRTSPSRSHE